MARVHPYKCHEREPIPCDHVGSSTYKREGKAGGGAPTILWLCHQVEAIHPSCSLKATAQSYAIGDSYTAAAAAYSPTILWAVVTIG